MDEKSDRPFRVTFVTGVSPDRWGRTWRRRFPQHPLELVPVDEPRQSDELRAGAADMAFVRLPVARDDLHLIPLWTERPVVVVSREHPVAAYDEIAVADLADEHLLQDPDTVPAWRDVAAEVRDGTRYPVPDLTLAQLMESVAADAGVAVLPMSVARVHHRKDVVAVPVTGVEPTRIGLAWFRDRDDPRLEAFVGVVRGRTENSSRGDGASSPEPASARSAEGRRQGSGNGPRSGRGARGGRSGRRSRRT